MDCDGVIANFVQHFINHAKLNITHDEWTSYCSYLDFMSEAEFREKLNIPNFWSTMPLYPWGRELLAVVQEVAGEWGICTKPAGVDFFYKDRWDWLQRHFQLHPANYYPVFHKHWLANPNTLLIDDDMQNIELFRKEGGLTLLFPSPWNSACGQITPTDVIQQLKRLQ